MTNNNQNMFPQKLNRTGGVTDSVVVSGATHNRTTQHGTKDVSTHNGTTQHGTKDVSTHNRTTHMELRM